MQLGPLRLIQTLIQTLTLSEVRLNGRLTGLSLLSAASAFILVLGSDLGAPGGGTGRQLLSVLLADAIGLFALLWLALDRRFEATSRCYVFGLALLLRLIAAHASPLLEDDHYRYLWDGLRTATTFDPYRLPPSAYFADPELALVWQDILSGINNPDIPTIYGPVLQGLFALAYWIAPARLGALQGLLVAVDLLALLVLMRQNVNRRALLAYAVHPLILKEAIASAHPDGLMALFLLLAMVAWQRRWPITVGLLLGAAVATKVAAVIAVPFLLIAPHAWHDLSGHQKAQLKQALWWFLMTAFACAASVTIFYLPFVLTGGSDAQALGVFGQQWRFNPLGFRFIEWLVPVQFNRLTSGLLVVASVLLLTWRWRRDRSAEPANAIAPIDTALVLLLLLSPVVNPWYWLWALALSVKTGRHWIAVAACCTTLSYLNTVVFGEAFGPATVAAGRGHAVAWPLTVLQVYLIGTAWYLFSRYRQNL